MEEEREERDWDGYDPGDPPLPCEEGDHEPEVIDGVTRCLACGIPQIDGVWVEDEVDR